MKCLIVNGLDDISINVEGCQLVQSTECKVWQAADLVAIENELVQVVKTWRELSICQCTT